MIRDFARAAVLGIAFLLLMAEIRENDEQQLKQTTEVAP